MPSKKQVEVHFEVEYQQMLISYIPGTITLEVDEDADEADIQQKIEEMDLDELDPDWDQERMGDCDYEDHSIRIDCFEASE